MRWVLPEIVTKEIGYSAGKLRGMAQRGVLTRWVHYAVIDGHLHYDLEAIREWQSCAVSEARAAALKSDTRRMGVDTQSPSRRPRLPQTSRMRLATATG